MGRLGAGGMGQVYLARASSAGDEVGAPLVAVKVVHEQYAADSRFRERFAREIATARAVRSPRVVELLDADPDARVPWLATEYVPGPSLEQTVTDSGALPESAALDVAAGLAEALSALHGRGVVHRDMKPSNVMLAEDGPKLIDFGIARAFDETALTHTGGVLGPPGFMSPEQAAGEDVGPPSDVFSFASVIVFAATGRGPFGRTGSPLALLRRVIDDLPDTSGVPHRLLQAIQPCFARNPADRPTAPEMVSRLTSLTTVPGTSLPAPPTAVQPAAPRDPSGPRRVSRRAVLIGGTAAAGLTVAGAAGWIVARAANQPPPVRAPRWSVPGPPTGGTTPRVIAGDPSDRLFVAASDRVVALDPDSGATTWTYQLETHFQSTLNGVGFGANTLGCYITDGFAVTALDLGNGAEKWSKRVAALVHASDTATLCDLYSDNAVHGALTALFPTDGSVRWSKADDSSEIILSVISTRDYIHVQGESRIFTLDTSGQQLWEQPTPARASWVASSAGLFVASDKKVEALSPRTGTTTWSKIVSPEGDPRPAITCNDHTVYFADARALEAWDAVTGEQRWRVEHRVVDGSDTTDVQWSFLGAPACTADHVLVTERGSTLSPTAPDELRVSVRSAHDGTALWTTPLPAGHDDVGYTVATNQVYVTSAPAGRGGAPGIHAMSLRDATS